MEEADSMSSINQKFYEDTGATFGRKKAPRRSQILTP
jgi:hypothetical protein